MTYVLRKDGTLLQEVKFIGEGLYRDHLVKTIEFETERQAIEIANILGATVEKVA